MTERDPEAAGPVRRLDTLGNDDVELVGWKNASLGEMVRRLGDAGVRVPDGFATTAAAYRSSLNPDRVLEVLRRVARAEAALEVRDREGGGGSVTEAPEVR